MFIAVVCLVLTSMVMARSFGILASPSQIVMMDDPNGADDANEADDPNEPIEIPE